jgi:hypothetical protein
MESHFFKKGVNSSIKELADKLNGSYYQVIKKLSSNILRHTEHIPEILDMEVVAFKKKAKEAGHAFRQYIDLREEVLLPYLYELFEKKTGGHNCLNCSGNCGVQHNLKITELTRSISNIKDTIGKMSEDLQKIKTIQKDIALKVLCTELELINNTAIELVLLEEEVLLPQIIEAQKHINAYS